MGWVVACCVLVGALIGVVVHYERALSRMARWLRTHEQRSNERLAVDSVSPGVRAMGSAVDALLANGRQTHAQEILERKTFKADLASLSHDLRTPLSGATGYLELYATRESPQDRDRCVAIARERLAAMKLLVDDLFSYSTALEGVDEMVCRPVELYPLVTRVLLGLYPAFEERGWEPIVDFADEEITVAGDPDALQRVFSNLTSNALRHGAAAPRVVQRGRRITFANQVDDPDTIDVDRLFDRFYRCDSARGGGGSGLGLAIVAQLCGAMGMHAGANLSGDVLEIWVDM